MPELQQRSMATQKVAAYLKLAQESEGLWRSIIVFLGALFLLGTIPFYPVYLVPVLAAICGIAAYRVPWLGTLLSMVFALPAISYQSPVFGWVFGLALAIVMFEMFEQWIVISTLQILIFAPFSFGQLPLFGWITILGMTLGSFHFGSRKSLFIAIPSVLCILLLSSVWLVDNSAFMPIKKEIYMPGVEALKMKKPALDLLTTASAIVPSLGSLFTSETAAHINETIGLFFGNTMKILFSDSGLIQLATWAIALYSASYLSGRFRKHAQVYGSFSLVLVPVAYFAIGALFGVVFSSGLLLAIAASITCVAILEHFGVSITREEEVERLEKQKSFGKFGLQDLALGKSEKSLADIGGYDDVKEELRDAILMPLEKKELAYTYGIKPPSGILLFGPPGTGKTMLMRALAKELKYGFYYIKSSDILSQWYGESLPFSEKLIVQDSFGRIRHREIGKIVEEKQPLKVLSFDANGKVVFATIKDWIKHRCTSPIYEVRTRTGRKIRVTDYHSLFALNGTKIESILTSQLVPGVSHIAIPSKMNFSTTTVDSIDFVEALRLDDRRLFVKNPAPHIQLAIKNLGASQVARLLGYKSNHYLYHILKENVGVRVGLFLNLMDKAGVAFEKTDLRIGSGKKTLPGIIKLNTSWATFLGLWVAEGSYNRKDTVRISISKTELETISAICQELFGKITIYQKRNKDGKEGNGRDIYIGSRPLYVLFKHVLGLDHGSNKKRIPEIAFNFNPENLAALLRGYFSGDGNIQINQRGVVQVEASTVSVSLADDLLYLLLYFGIVASIHSKKEWNGRPSTRISLVGYKKLRTFLQIGFLDPVKNKAIEEYVHRITASWHRSDLIPLNIELKNIVNRHTGRYGGPAYAYIGRDILLETDWEGEEPEFLRFIENDIYLDRVEEIKRVEDEEFVYDISVDPCQNFVGGIGGIFAHNSEKNVSEIFSIARKNAPSILFFDEMDSIGKKRTAYSADDVGPRILSVLLQEMDGVKTSKPVMIVGATNVPQQLDPALLRPGRFDKIIYMHLPPAEARGEIFQVHLRKVPVGPEVDLQKLVKKTDRFSGADIRNAVQEAIKLAAKEAARQGQVVPIGMEHLLRVLEQVKPSTGLAALEEYERFQMDFERRVGGKKEEKPREEIVKWEDVAGLANVKEALLEAIELPLLHEKEMRELKVKPSKGILLFGPPGTGKTMIAKAASSELKASFQVMSGAELLREGYTRAVTVIKETFNRARENSPAIVFIDEIETLAPARGSMGASGEVLGQFLTELDGIRELKGVVLIGATNKPSFLDPAILRPGRFDKIFYIPPPDSTVRAELFRIHLVQFIAALDVQELADGTEGFSGADIAAICQEVKMQALREKIAGKAFTPTTEMVLRIIRKRRPSITPDLLKEFEVFMEVYGERGRAEEEEQDPAEEKRKKTKSGKEPPDMHYR